MSETHETKLSAWWNGYEVVVASSEEEARDITGALEWNKGKDEDMRDGDGWKVLPDDKVVLDEDGKPTKETFGDLVQKLGKPGHLYSCEP
jgi:hypothetical protein